MDPNKHDATCQHCLYWGAEADFGSCHRRAPTRGETGGAVWPLTFYGEWCGDFRPAYVVKTEIREKQ